MNYILPALILALLLYGLAKGVNIYEAFVKGAADALPMLLYILPYMTAMLAGLTVFRQTGALDRLVGWIAPLFQWIGLPKELVPLFVLRPFSGGAAVALLQDVYTQYGPDGFLGYCASVMLGSTETIFYTLALYFGAAKITKTRHAVPVALFAGVVGAIAAIVFARGAGV